MRVLFAPAAIEGELSAGQVGVALARGWAQTAPHDELVVAPLSDGGPGFVEVVHAGLGGDLLPTTVTGPLGDPVPATVLLTTASSMTTAYIEAAEACGLHLLALADRDAGRTTTYGVGELLLAALGTGASRIVVGVGGTATNDGGAGLLAALGVGPTDRLGRGGAALAELSELTELTELTGLPQARDLFRDVRLEFAAATDVRLLGFHGTSATYAEGKGATAEQAQALESGLGRFADLATRSLVAGRPLLGSWAAEPGAGAGGGIGFALLVLGGQYVDGVAAVMHALDLPARAAGCDLIVCAEATFDWTSLRAGVVAQVADLGLRAGVPCVLLAREVMVGRRESLTLGLSGCYAVDGPAGGPTQDLSALASRVARTWSPVA